MKTRTMVVASPAAPCDPSSISLVLLDVLPMITSGLRDFTQELYFGSPGQVRSNIALVAIPFARAHSSAPQSWSVTPVNSNMPSSARVPLPPPASHDHSLWQYQCGILLVGAGSVSDLVGVDG